MLGLASPICSFDAANGTPLAAGPSSVPAGVGSDVAWWGPTGGTGLPAAVQSDSAKQPTFTREDGKPGVSGNGEPFLEATSLGLRANQLFLAGAVTIDGLVSGGQVIAEFRDNAGGNVARVLIDDGKVAFQVQFAGSNAVVHGPPAEVGKTYVFLAGFDGANVTLECGDIAAVAEVSAGQTLVLDKLTLLAAAGGDAASAATLHALFAAAVVPMAADRYMIRGSLEGKWR